MQVSKFFDYQRKYLTLVALNMLRPRRKTTSTISMEKTWYRRRLPLQAVVTRRK